MQLRIEPGCALGPFQLGASINDVIGVIKRDSIALRDNRLIFHQSDPLAADLLLDARDLGIRLRFAADTQRLYLIDAYSPTQLTFTYLHTSFSGPTHSPPSLSSVYATFGPSFPPQFDPQRQAWLLKYPGIAFVFDDYTAANTGVVQVMSDGELSYDDMDDRDVALTRILLLHGEHFTPPAPSLTSAAATLSLSSSHSVHAHVNRGLYLASRSLWLPFHHSIQDVLLDLGPPDSITWKSDEKMRIHASHTTHTSLPNSHHDPHSHHHHHPSTHTAAHPHTHHAASGCAGASSFFFNYYGLGLDLLMDARQGRVVKFVLHGNWAGSREFAQYGKCDYALLVRHGGSGSGSHKAGDLQGRAGRDGVGAVGGEGSLVPMACVGCNARWPDVQRLLVECGCEVSRGMLNGVGGGSSGEKGVPRSPFGGTMYYAARGVLFEVLKTGYLQTVTLFYEPSLQDASK